MKKQLTKSPINISLDAGFDEFIYYHEGIITAKECESRFTSHAVLLVGYNTEGEIPYFIIKNSWGTEWGENGYAKLEISDGYGTCGMN